MKDYHQLRHELDTPNTPEVLEEGILRKGAALLYGSKAKTEGDKIVRAVQSARGSFDKAKKEEGLEKKVQLLAEGLDDLSIGIIYTRMMLGNITGVGVSSAVFSEKNIGLLEKIMKGLKIR